MPLIKVKLNSIIYKASPEGSLRFWDARNADFRLC